MARLELREPSVSQPRWSAAVACDRTCSAWPNYREDFVTLTGLEAKFSILSWTGHAAAAQMQYPLDTVRLEQQTQTAGQVRLGGLMPV